MVMLEYSADVVLLDGRLAGLAIAGTDLLLLLGPRGEPADSPLVMRRMDCSWWKSPRLVELKGLCEFDLQHRSSAVN